MPRRELAVRLGRRPHVIASVKPRGAGGQGSAVPADGSALKAMDLASSELAWAKARGFLPGLLGRGRRQSLGRVLPRSNGIGGESRRGHIIRGGADPDSVADAGLGVDGVSLLFLPWLVHCEVGGWRSRDMDAGATVPDGGPHGWLSGGHHGGGDGCLLVVWTMSGVAAGDSVSLSVADNGDTQIWLWRLVLVTVVLVASWWHG